MSTYHQLRINRKGELTTRPNNRSHQVVIVEPDAAAAAIRKVLEDDGLQVTTVGDGQSLLAILAHHHPDLVILALMLPDIRGLEILREIQATSQVPTIG